MKNPVVDFGLVLRAVVFCGRQGSIAKLTMGRLNILKSFNRTVITIFLLNAWFQCISSSNVQSSSPVNKQTGVLAFASILKYLGTIPNHSSDSVKKDINYILNLLKSEEFLKDRVPLESCSDWDAALLQEDIKRQVNGEPSLELNSSVICQSDLRKRCLSIEGLVSLLGDQASVTLPAALQEVCPLLLFQSHDPECSQPEPHSLLKVPESLKTTDTTADQPKSRERPSAAAVWGFGFLFVTVVSCCSLVGVALLPLLSKNIYQTVLVLFEGLAVGSLAASALFHLIPQAFGLLGQDREHKYLWRSLIIFGGIYLFFLSERGMKIIIQKKQHKKMKRVNADVASLTLSPSDLSTNSHVLGNGKPALSIHDIVNKENGSLPINNDTEACSPPITHVHHGHSHGGAVAFSTSPPQKDGAKQAIATVAWMIIFGDGLHNFIDGLSMGAAFSDSILSGISISVAVICEEFPHELGDFAVLLSAGMTLKQALMYNFLSACTCYLGLVFGIFLGDLADGGPYIFALAGGMFLYISLVDMMGELSEAMEEASQKGTREMIKVFALQNLGILIGVAALFLMARYSERINFESLSGFQPDEVHFFGNNAEQLLGTFGDA